VGSVVTSGPLVLAGPVALAAGTLVRTIHGEDSDRAEAMRKIKAFGDYFSSHFSHNTAADLRVRH
jgi:hypothetical protein